MPGTLDILRSRWQDTVTQLQALNDRATNENRELTEAEQANAEDLQRSEATLRGRIASQVELEQSVTSTQELLRNVNFQTTSMVPFGSGNGGEVIRPDAVIQTQDRDALVRSLWPTPGDYMHDIIHAHQGDLEARGRIERAIQNEVTGDVPGIVPTPIVGDLVNIIDASRPVVSYLRSYGMPQYGASFTRPKVVQHTLVGEQTTQKTELPSRKFTVNPLNVNKMTLGGAIDVAFQVIDWTQPSALNAITTDLADQYAIQTESVGAGLIDAAATATVPLAGTPPTSANWIAAITAASATVYNAVKRMPDVIFASPDVWAMLVGLVDTTGRPVMNAGSPMNSVGNGSLKTTSGSILGLDLVTSFALPAKNCIIGCSQFAEVYEDRRGALRVVEPKLLGWEIAYYGYFAGLVTDAGAFCSVTVP